MRPNEYLPEGMEGSGTLLREYAQSLAGLEKAIADDVILEGKAMLCDGDHGLHVDLGGGLYGIIPFSECSLDSPAKPIAAISRVGKTVCFKVTDMRHDEYGKLSIMLSRRAAQRECRSIYIDALSAGDVIPARITHLEQFGAFADIGCGVVSLLPIDSMSVSRIAHPSDRFRTGQFIHAAVKSPCDENGRLILTHRELLGTWEENAAAFSAGQTVTGIVRSVERYGVFIELTPNLAGLAEYSDEISAGECVSVFIKNIVPQKMKIKLVVIDRADCVHAPHDYDYYITTGNIRRWVYSPEECNKVIETVFGQ